MRHHSVKLIAPQSQDGLKPAAERGSHPATKIPAGPWLSTLFNQMKATAPCCYVSCFRIFCPWGSHSHFFLKRGDCSFTIEIEIYHLWEVCNHHSLRLIPIVSLLPQPLVRFLCFQACTGPMSAWSIVWPSFVTCLPRNLTWFLKWSHFLDVIPKPH